MASASAESVDKGDMYSEDVQNTDDAPVTEKIAEEQFDHGWLAWSQILGGFFLTFNSWGVVNTFGSYQTYYETGELFVASSSNIAWIGSIQAFLLLGLGAVIGPIFDRGYFRSILLLGTFMLVFGQMMLSLVHEFWQALLAQAFCNGIGCACLFVPAVAIVPQYFRKRTGLALGIVAAGSSIGGIIYPIMFHNLLDKVGFGWTTRIIGFVALATLVVPNVFLKIRHAPATKRAFIDPKAFKDAPYLIYSAGCVLGFMGLYMPFFYIQYYAIVAGAVDDSLGFYILPILNAVSTFGRILPNLASDIVGPLNVTIPMALLSGVLCILLIPGANLAGIICIAILYGFASGTFVSLPPAVVVSFTEDRSNIGTRMGMVFAFSSIGVLIGTPVGGVILGSAPDGQPPSLGNLRFDGVWIFGGVLIISGAAFYAVARFVKTKGKLIIKV